MNKWLEYWQQDELHADVFTNKDGKKHDNLRKFWQTHIAELKSSSSLLDIASGAGAIYRCIPNIKEYEANALDISKEALAMLKADIPTIKIHPEFLNSKSFGESKFDAVLSQFGIEYLGDSGFMQVPRLLKSGGKCVFLSHIKDGVIDRRTQQSLHGLTLLQDIQFLSRAAAVADAFALDQRQVVEQSVKAFTSIEPKIAAYCTKVPSGHHVHLYQGIKQLLSQYNSYGHAAVIKWIDEASKQASQNMERLASMHKAALAKDDIIRITALFEKKGLTITNAIPFRLNPEEPPVAWEIVGAKR